MMKKLVSLLLALVMALGLCTSAIAETNGESEDVQTGNETYTMDTVLAGVDELTGNEAEKTAIKNYLNTYFVVADNKNGVFVVINNVGLRQDKFIQTQEQKATVQNAVDGYNAQIGDTNRSIAAILDAYQVKYGNGTRTFGDLMGMYTAALKRPAVQINEGSNGPDTGKVEGTHLLKSSDGTDYLYNNAEYITTADANAAIEYFNKYFTYRTWELGNGSEYNTVTYSDSIYDKETDKITDEAKAKEAITEYNNLAPAVQVSLNELEIRVATGPNGTEQFRFWRLIQRFDKQLNGSQGGGNNPGGPPPSTGNVTDVSNLPGNGQPNEEAKVFLGQNGYMEYTYTSEYESDISFRGVSIDNKGRFVEAQKVRAAITAYKNLSQEAKSILNNLRICADDEQWTFSRRMWHLERMLYFSESSNSSRVTPVTMPKDGVVEALLEAGFTAPVLGDDFAVAFPSQLERYKDYDYNYSIIDNVGVLTVEVRAGDRAHWLEAASASDDGDITYGIVFRNKTGANYHGSAFGNGGSGYWQVWAANEETLKNSGKATTHYNSLGLAAVNQQNGVMTVNAIENYGEMMALSVWNNASSAKEGAPVKHLLTMRIRIVDQFTYEAEAGMGEEVLPAVNVQDEKRVSYTLNGENTWRVVREKERLVVRPAEGTLADKFAANNDWSNVIGTLTVATPIAGYKLAAVNGNPVNNGGDTWICDRFFPQSNGQNTSGVVTTRQFTLTWTSNSDQYAETFTLYIGENSAVVKNELNEAYKELNNGRTTIVAFQSANDAQQDISDVSGSSVDVVYDSVTGGFHTTFDSSKPMPTAEQLEQGMVIEPGEGIDKTKVARFHVHPFQTNADPADSTSDWFKDILKGFQKEREDSNKSDQIFDYKAMEDNIARTIPFVATNSVTHGDVTVYFAFTQAYRGKVIEWVDAQGNVLGYTFAYGRNDPFVATTRTEVKPGGEDGRPTGKPGDYNEPFAVGPDGGMFWCERYPQEGGNGQKWYFRLRVSGHSEWSGEYTVYLPYSYLEITDAEAQRLINSGRKARIDHYVNGDGMAPETLEGTYTEWGICFKTRSFSPFVISTAAQSSSGGGYYYGGASTPGISAVKTADAAKSATDYTSGIYGLTFRSTAAFSGFKGVQVDGRTIAAANYVAEDNGGIEVYLKAVYLRTLKDGRHTVTILSDAGNVTMNFTIGGVDSPTTFDAGIGAYIGMALASVGGMAWMRRRKR